jgi:hypothetical protein
MHTQKKYQTLSKSSAFRALPVSCTMQPIKLAANQACFSLNETHKRNTTAPSANATGRVQPPLGYLICWRCCCDCLAASAASCPTGITSWRDAACPDAALWSTLPAAALSACTTCAPLMACTFCAGRPCGTTAAAPVWFTCLPRACASLLVLTMRQAPKCLILTLRQAAMQLLL